VSDLTGPLDAHALAEGIRILKLLPAGIEINHVPMHWSVEGWMVCDGAYNIVISLHGDQWNATIATDPTLNASEPPQPGYAAHTWMRNSFGCGIAVDGMVGATTTNFGPEPIQMHELEVLCAVAAAVGTKYSIDTHGSYEGVSTYPTHAECAIADAYYLGSGDPEERWDLAELRAAAVPPSPQTAAATAVVLRTRIAEYKRAMA
jgi:hypothetical protein